MISASDLMNQLDDLLAWSKTLEDARYLPNIPVKTVQERLDAGLPLCSRVWPNHGDRLEPLPKKTPGLHSPFAYVADERFRVVFNCHREDYDLHSIDFLHVGRKICEFCVIVNCISFLMLRDARGREPENARLKRLSCTSHSQS